jgi:hypothetical protein
MLRSSPEAHIVERAFSLARSGHYATGAQLTAALRLEGYSQADFMHLQGRVIVRQIARERRQARAVRDGRAQT